VLALGELPDGDRSAARTHEFHQQADGVIRPSGDLHGTPTRYATVRVSYFLGRHARPRLVIPETARANRQIRVVGGHMAAGTWLI